MSAETQYFALLCEHQLPPAACAQCLGLSAYRYAQENGRLRSELAGMRRENGHLRRNIERYQEVEAYPGQWNGMAKELKETKKKNGRLFKQRAALCRLVGVPIVVDVREDDDPLFRRIEELMMNESVAAHSEGSGTK